MEIILLVHFKLQLNSSISVPIKYIVIIQNESETPPFWVFLVLIKHANCVRPYFGLAYCLRLTKFDKQCRVHAYEDKTILCGINMHHHPCKRQFLCVYWLVLNFLF